MVFWGGNGDRTDGDGVGIWTDLLDRVRIWWTADRPTEMGGNGDEFCPHVHRRRL